MFWALEEDGLVDVMALLCGSSSSMAGMPLATVFEPALVQTVSWV